MTDILDDILTLAASFEARPDFLDHIFRERKPGALQGQPVVLFGAGQLAKEFCATLRQQGIEPVAFCDNNPAKAGQILMGLPIITFAELKRLHADSLILIAVSAHAAAIEGQLLAAGFGRGRILCKPSDTGEQLRLLYLYAMNGAWSLLPTITANVSPRTIVDVLTEDREKINQTYHLLADEKSCKLYVCKLALLASGEHFELYAHFLTNFSEPALESGLGDQFKTEEHYYFNNDALAVDQDEIYVDVGAADGDTIATFTEACRERGITPKQIIAFEPDPANFAKLVANMAARPEIVCHRLGLWTHGTTLRFSSSAVASSHESAAINACGDIEIEAVGLDEFLAGTDVSFIKMDPPGNVVPQALKGAATTITRCGPKLALGVYHSVQAIYEIPILVHRLRPDYKIYLRHHARHTNETDLLAHV
jgi:FkbM family methyltransferase